MKVFVADNRVGDVTSCTDDLNTHEPTTSGPGLGGTFSIHNSPLSRGIGDM
jgi:hypothetical protein